LYSFTWIFQTGYGKILFNSIVDRNVIGPTLPSVPRYLNVTDRHDTSTRITAKKLKYAFEVACHNRYCPNEPKGQTENNSECNPI